MKYEKPDVALIGSASAVVQTTAKSAGNPDAKPQPTSAAYEADE
jgi:hypothetical protein